VIHISVALNPIGKLKVYREAVLYLLRLLLEREIGENAFLRDCGIAVSQEDDLSLSFAPIAGLRIKEASVAHLLKRVLELRINENEFLTACGIQLTVEDNENNVNTAPVGRASQWNHCLSY
jgi:hypothetical protein